MNNFFDSSHKDFYPFISWSMGRYIAILESTQAWKIESQKLILWLDQLQARKPAWPDKHKAWNHCDLIIFEPEIMLGPLYSKP